MTKKTRFDLRFEKADEPWIVQKEFQDMLHGLRSFKANDYSFVDLPLKKDHYFHSLTNYLSSDFESILLNYRVEPDATLHTLARVLHDLKSVEEYGSLELQLEQIQQKEVERKSLEDSSFEYVSLGLDIRRKKQEWEKLNYITRYKNAYTKEIDISLDYLSSYTVSTLLEEL